MHLHRAALPVAVCAMPPSTEGSATHTVGSHEERQHASRAGAARVLLAAEGLRCKRLAAGWSVATWWRGATVSLCSARKLHDHLLVCQLTYNQHH